MIEKRFCPTHKTQLKKRNRREIKGGSGNTYIERRLVCTTDGCKYREIVLLIPEQVIGTKDGWTQPQARRMN